MRRDAFVQTAAREVHHANATATSERVAMVVHEINQPLAAIMTNAEVAAIWLKHDAIDLDEVRAAIDCIIANCMRAANVARAVSDQTPFPTTASGSADINHVVETILDQMSADLRWRGIAVRTHLANDIGCVPGCRVQLGQVVSNLVTNAIEAMDKVHRSRRTLRIVTAGDDHHVRMVVEDSGPGIEPAKAIGLFEPRVSTKKGGKGLGLSICRSIVEAHGGRLWAAPNVPHGSVFSVALPALRTG